MNAVSTAPITGSNNSSASPGNANAKMDASNSPNVSALGGRLPRHSAHASQSLLELAEGFVPRRRRAPVARGVAPRPASRARVVLAPSLRPTSTPTRAHATRDPRARAHDDDDVARVTTDADTPVAPIPMMSY
jgi:hypothetical protein